MAVLEIIQHPNPHLHQPAERVEEYTDEVRRIIRDLYDTMYYYSHCVGLAAPQVAISKQIAVIDVSTSRSEPLCLVNPVITSREGNVTQEESCMSVPSGIADKVGRAQKVTVNYWDENEVERTLTGEDFLARAIQHEVDHLQGKLFLHCLSRLKRERLEKRISKQQRHERQQKSS